jgi:MtaA/CmuA family methyltransferase
MADRLPVQPLFMIHAADVIGVKYSDYVRDHRLLVKGQLVVAERYGVDLVSCCSDAWREAADCGTPLLWSDHQPPTAERHIISSPDGLRQLRMPDPEGGGRMTDRLNAIRLFAEQVKGEIPILGWVEGPAAEAADLMGVQEFAVACLEEPEFALDLMDWVTEMETRFALAQVRAGADMIGIGDAVASLVTPDFYAGEVAPREKKIVDAVHSAGASVRLHICGSVRGKFAAMAATCADLIDIDFPQTLREAREGGIPPTVCLSGNLNPVTQLLQSTPGRIKEDFARCYAEAGPACFVAPGCEVPPGTPEENIMAMKEFACEQSALS